MAKQGPSTQQRAHQGVVWLIFFRLLLAVIAIAVILVGAVARSEGWPAAQEELAVYFIFVFIFLLTLGYLFAMRWVQNYFRYAFAQIVVDIVIESALVYFTGGVESNLVFLYFASILAGSMVLSGEMAVFFAAEATILLSGVTIAAYMGWGPESAGAQAELLKPERLGSVLTFHFAQAVAFFLVAVLSSSLAKRLSTARVFSEEILESIGQGIAAFDSEDTLTFANSELARILGRSAPRPGQSAAEALGQMAAGPVGEALLDHGPQLVEIELERSDGATVPLRIKTVPVSADEGGYRGTIVVMTDLSLERRVEDAMTQAERASAISEMSASIAHEIRNPLASIRGAVQEIERSTDLAGPNRSLMDIVVSESDRLDNIISDFLDFARMRPVRKVDCDLAAIISESVTLIERAVDDGRSVLVEEALPGPLPLRADSEQLRQVFLNLGLNSIAALGGGDEGEGDDGAERGGVRIAIAAQTESRGNFGGKADRVGAEELAQAPGVTVSFSDNGCGMDEATRRRAFDPFFTTRTGGSGLGLSIVSRIVRGHDGRIEISSREGEGTDVRFWLPLM